MLKSRHRPSHLTEPARWTSHSASIFHVRSSIFTPAGHKPQSTWPPRALPHKWPGNLSPVKSNFGDQRQGSTGGGRPQTGAGAARRAAARRARRSFLSTCWRASCWKRPRSWAMQRPMLSLSSSSACCSDRSPREGFVLTTATADPEGHTARHGATSDGTAEIDYTADSRHWSKEMGRTERREYARRVDGAGSCRRLGRRCRVQVGVLGWEFCTSGHQRSEDVGDASVARSEDCQGGTEAQDNMAG